MRSPCARRSSHVLVRSSSRNGPKGIVSMPGPYTFHAGPSFRGSGQENLKRWTRNTRNTASQKISGQEIQKAWTRKLKRWTRSFYFFLFDAFDLFDDRC